MPWDQKRGGFFYKNRYNFISIHDIVKTDIYKKATAMIKKLSPEEIAKVVSSSYWADKIVKEKGLALHGDDVDTVRIAAIHQCKDQKALADAVMREDEYDIYSEAIERITDQELLLNIVNEAKSKKAQGLAVASIEDQELLVRIVFEETIPESYMRYRYYPDVRISCAKNIKDQEVLKKIFLTDNEHYVRDAALRKIVDEDFHYEYAMNEIASDKWYCGLGRTAVSQIKNQQRLLNIARHGPNKAVRYSAVYHMQDPAIQLDFVLQSRDSDFILSILRKVGETHMQLLIDLARQQTTGCSDSFRKHLIAVIDDIDTLSYMAEHEKETSRREDAAYKLNKLMNPSED